MKLWETYFRTWKSFGESLTQKRGESQTGKSTDTMESAREQDRGKYYYGYLCDKDVCIESGV